MCVYQESSKLYIVIVVYVDDVANTMEEMTTVKECLLR